MRPNTDIAAARGAGTAPTSSRPTRRTTLTWAPWGVEDFRLVLTRRRLLQVGALALVGLGAGCRASGPAPPRPAGDPDVALRARIGAQEGRLIAAYDATMVRYPRLRAALAPVRADHAAHLVAVSDRPAAGGSATAAVPTGSSGADARAWPVPGNAEQAVRALVAAERGAATARAADCRGAPRELAGLVASIGGSAAAHASVLPALVQPKGVRPDQSQPPGPTGVSVPTPVPVTALSPAVSTALNQALAGEQAAGYAFGVVGARLGNREQPAAAAALETARVQRDLLVRVITAGGGTPEPADPAYALPFPVPTRVAALRLAVLVDDRLAGLDVALAAASTDPALRSIAAAAVQARATDAASWRLRAGIVPVTVAFPGR